MGESESAAVGTTDAFVQMASCRMGAKSEPGSRREQRGGLLVVAAIALVATPLLGELHAQDASERLISGRPACNGCSVALRKIVTLGRATDPELIPEFPPQVTKDGRGNYLVNALSGGFIVFDSTGSFVKVVGRAGDGPDEYGRRISAFMPARGESLYVQVGTERLMLLDANYREIRRIPLNIRGINTGESLAGGSIMFSSTARRPPDTARVFLQQVLPSGVLGGSWTFREVIGVDACPVCSQFALGAALTGDQLWLAHKNVYLLERRAADGQVLGRFRVTNSPWLREWTGEVLSIWGPERPHATITNIFERPDGLLVVHGVAPAADWRPAPASTGRGARGGRASPPPGSLTDLVADIGMRNAHTVDVIDPARGVLASVTVQNMTVQPFDGRYARRIVTDSAGFVQVEIWEVVFQDGRAPSRTEPKVQFFRGRSLTGPLGIPPGRITGSIPPR